ncbi:hypothetical protein PINS_up002931 [Pythium insidiosum]|nr:hypothetical protein PINS_up002931 [Pythium insidiosum]
MLSSSFVSSGYSIRRPRERVTKAQDASYANYRYVDAGDDSDAQACAVLRELAQQHAMDQARAAVRATLLKANESCYHRAHRFLQRYMGVGKHAVSLPTLTKQPAVAIVRGTDALFSDVWMTPLCHVIQRSFPLVIVLNDDVSNARQLLEWILEKLEDYRTFRKVEEAWLVEQIDEFVSFTADETRRQSQRPKTPRACL